MKRSLPGLMLIAWVIAVSGCDECEAPVNANLTLHIDVASGVVPAGKLFLAATDANGATLARYAVGVDRIEFPYDLVWYGNCDEGQMPAGTYVVTGWLSSPPASDVYAPGPAEPRASTSVEIIETGSARSATSALYLTIAPP